MLPQSFEPVHASALLSQVSAMASQTSWNDCHRRSLSAALVCLLSSAVIARMGGCMEMREIEGEG